MAIFAWEGRTRAGEVKKGVMDADNEVDHFVEVATIDDPVMGMCVTSRDDEVDCRDAAVCRLDRSRRLGGCRLSGGVHEQGELARSVGRRPVDCR